MGKCVRQTGGVGNRNLAEDAGEEFVMDVLWRRNGMEVRKQVWIELKYTKKLRHLALVIPLTLCATLFLREWLLVYAILVGYMEYLLRRNRSGEVPQILSFLPMEQKERRRYVRRRSDLISGAFGLYLTVCLLSCYILYKGRSVNRVGTGCMLVIGISYFLKTREQLVAEENAAYRRYERSLYRKLCCPLWYQEMNNIAVMLRTALLVISYYWCDLYHETGAIPVQWIWGLTTGLAVLFLFHILMMRHSIAIVDMGDYGGKRDKAVEHEY
ncbi:MAG: hypothetical protein IJ801_10520 [Lachnospiraceae bacterium]|nr:hypothetical protein [Lachnospiraceae bacterium]